MVSQSHAHQKNTPKSKKVLNEIHIQVKLAAGENNERSEKKGRTLPLFKPVFSIHQFQQCVEDQDTIRARVMPKKNTVKGKQE